MTTEPDASQPRIRHDRRLAAKVLLALTLLAVIAYLVVAFQPFADAAGGCGGG